MTLKKDSRNEKGRVPVPFGFDDVVGAVKERLYERAKSPFIGAFIIAWMAINFRAIYALLMARSYTEAFQIIDNKIWSTPIIAAWLTIVFPALSVFLYLYFVPIFEREAIKLWINGKLKVSSARISIEEAAPLENKSIEQYADHISELNSKFKGQLTTLRIENADAISALKRELEIMRERYCESLIPEGEIKNALSNMTETDRDILWVASRLQAAPNNIVTSKEMLGILQSLREDITERVVSQSVYSLSMHGLIKQDFKGPTLDAVISLGARGRDLAIKMEAAGLSPKLPIGDLNENWR